MIIDHRTYELHPNKLPDWLKLWESQALPMHMKYMGESFVGMFQTEVGQLNQVVHLWRYDSMADREKRRGALEADPGWHDFRRAVREQASLKQLENKILKPVAFSPMK